MTKDQTKNVYRLIELKQENKKVRTAIGNLQNSAVVDQLMLQRLKRRQSVLEGEIKKAETSILPDIIA